MNADLQLIGRNVALLTLATSLPAITGKLTEEPLIPSFCNELPYTTLLESKIPVVWSLTYMLVKSLQVSPYPCREGIPLLPLPRGLLLLLVPAPVPAPLSFINASVKIELVCTFFTATLSGSSGWNTVSPAGTLELVSRLETPFGMRAPLAGSAERGPYNAQTRASVSKDTFCRIAAVVQ